MGGLGRIIGGALAGLGEGLEQQTLVNYQNAREEMASRRAIALENLRHQYRGEEMQTQADLNDRNAGRDDARAFVYDTKKTEQKGAIETAQIRLKGDIDLKNDTVIEGLKHQHNLAEGAADDARDLQKELQLAGVTVDHWEVTTDGRLAAFNKRGERLSQSSKPGTFQTKGGGGDEDEGGTIASARAARGGGSAAQKPQKPQKQSAQPSADEPILAQLARMPPPPDGKVGRTMTGPNGIKARWTGKVWELIGETVPRG